MSDQMLLDEQLLYAVFNEQLKEAETLLIKGANANVRYHDNDWTILMCAIEANNLDLVKMLLKYGADVNERKFNNTPLSIALTNIPINKEIVELLLDHDVDVYHKDESPLEHLAQEVNFYETYSWNCGFPREGYELYVTSAEHLLFLKERNQEVLDTTRLILNHEKCQNIVKETALEWALLRGNKELIKLLIEYGADVNYEPEKGCALIFLCFRRFEYEDDEMLLYFIDHGYDLNKKIDHSTLLDACIYLLTDYGHVYMIKIIRHILTKEGIDLSIRNRFGDTPLIMAASNKIINEKGIDIIEKLLELGANLYDRNDRNETALDKAKYENRTNIVNVLENYELKHVMKFLTIVTSHTLYELPYDVRHLITPKALVTEKK